MKKRIAAVSVLVLLLLVGIAAGAGGWYYYGRWVDTQSTYVPVDEPISVKTLGVPALPIYPGESFGLQYEITNNGNNDYEMTNVFSGDWEVVKECKIKIVSGSTTVFEKVFTNATVKAGEITSEKTSSSDCMINYTIPAKAIYQLEASVKIRNDAPTTKTAESWKFYYYMHTYRGRDEEPPYYYGEG